MLNLAGIDYLIILIPISAYFLIGYINRKKASTFNGFFLIDRKLTSAQYTMTFVATNISASTVLLALSSQSYQVGISVGWLVFAWIIGILLFGYLVNRKDSKLSNFFQSGYTLHEFLDEPTYQSKTLRRIAALVTVFTFVATVGIELYACTFVLKHMLAPSMSKFAIAVIIALIMIMYTNLSGFVGAVKTDIIQLVILVGGLSLLTYFGIRGVDRVGYDVFLRNLLPGETFLRSIWYAGTEWILAAFVLMIPFQLSVSDMWQRCCAIKGKKKAISKSLFISALLFVPFWFVPIFIGVVVKCFHPNIESADAFVYFLDLLRSPWAGFVLAGFFAAIISSADTLLVNASLVFLYDVYGPTKQIDFKGLSKDRDRTIMTAARLWIIVFGLVAIIFVFLGKSLYHLIVTILSIQIVLFVPLFYGVIKKEGLPRKKYGAVFGVVFGFLFAFFTVIYGNLANDLNVLNSAPIVGFVSSLVFFVLFSFIKKAKIKKDRI